MKNPCLNRIAGVILRWWYFYTNSQ